MTNNSNRAAEYRTLIDDLFYGHVELARKKTFGLDTEEIMFLRDFIARIERKALAKAKSKK